MKKVAYTFKDAGVLDANQMGGKALNLVRLRNQGSNVPNGFCLVSDVYREHLHQLSQNITDPAVELQKIREFILNKPIDSDATAQIEMCYKALSGSVVAVRSSATFEDMSGHSFAGQYETCLNIKTFDECLEAIKTCWASVWTERAYRYRQKNHIDHNQIQMAVIIQKQIDAEFSGVVFTCDPLTGKSDRIVIEVCRGLGDALVSGRVTPDQLIFTKSKLKLIWNLPAVLTKPCQFPICTARSVAKAAYEIEKCYHSPQDIEWAVRDNQIFILQARPVTVKPRDIAWEERQVWTNLNTGEVAPDAVTPLDWSIMERLLIPMFQKLFYLLSIDLGEHPFFGIVAGRIYFNMNTGMAFFTKLPKFLIPKPEHGNALFGGGDDTQYDLRKINLGPDDLPNLKVSIWKILLRFPYNLLQWHKHRLSQGLKLLEKIKLDQQRYQSIDLAAMTNRNLTQLLEEIIAKESKRLDILYMAVPVVYAPIVTGLCRRWLGDQHGRLANSLLSSAGNMEDVQAGIALQGLAQLAGRSPEIGRILELHESWQLIQDAAQKSQMGRDFVKAWGAFMNQHGHHCRSEILLSNPRWYEMPDYVLWMLKGSLHDMEQETPARQYEQRLKEKKESIDGILSTLKNPLKRLMLRKLVRSSLRGLAFRENLKSEIVRLLFLIRRILLTIGNKLKLAGSIEKTEDVFFLTFPELKSVTDGKDDFDIGRIISERQAEYERNKAIEPPQVVVGKFDSKNVVASSVDSAKKVFYGMSVCPGKVVGAARVILRADEHQQVLPGEILIAPFTDPGWTPYFLTASGIVMDQGGLLSHGSIVAREFGIPAVVNVGPATKIIHTGQRVEVDANNGVVRVLS
jgi:pyruvate,water dikinase